MWKSISPYSCISFYIVFIILLGTERLLSNEVAAVQFTERGGRRCYGGRRDIIGQLSSAVTGFTANLHKEAVGGKSDAVYSPYSIFQAMTMTYLGAGRNTAQNMKIALNLKHLGRCTHEAVRFANANMSDSTSVALKTANRLYVSDKVRVLEEFQQTLTSYYGSAILPFDWSHAGGPETPINAWVSNVTQGLIPRLLSAGFIQKDTALLLVNAIYFKGSWKTEFDKTKTTDEVFYKSADTEIMVPMMHLTGKFPFLSLDSRGVQILMIPYTGERFAMYVILPNDVHGLAAVESVLPSILRDSLDSLQTADVRLSLPRFKLQSSFDLKQALININMTEPFIANTADFSRITGTNNLYVSKVIHKAVVEVNEEGTEAAAATAVQITFTSTGFHKKVFTADHPFFFVIRDNVMKLPLFLGKYSGGS